MPLYSPANPVAFFALALAWLGLCGAMLMSRRPSSQAKSERARRDNNSLYGVVLQTIGIGLTWAGPIRFALPATLHLWLAAIPPAVIAFLTTGLFIWSTQTMGANWSLVARTREDHSLVQSGPFALVRNPIYVGLFGLMCANAISLGHVVNLIPGVPFFVVATLMRVHSEEKLLRAAFGSGYEAYALRLKRFIPLLW